MIKNLNKGHIFSGANQISRILYSLLMLVMVPLSLSGQEQGYWFSFMSLSALIIIADSGFSTIILQFAAHEFAHLKFDPSGTLAGDEGHLKRLASFFRFSLRWSSAVVAIAIPIIAAAGWYIMSRREAEVAWRLPWLLYVFGSVLVFLNNSLLYFFEGCDSVPKTQRIRTGINAAMILALFTGLAFGGKLYALSFSALTSALLGAVLIYVQFKPIIRQLRSRAEGYSHSWSKEFLPLLGRYSLSWVSGYFIFQMYTPIMFHYYGPVEAGKIGISITLWTGVLTLSNIWLSVVTPKMNIHVSRKQWEELDRLFFRNLTFSAATFLLGMLSVFGIYYIGAGRLAILNRFVSPLSMAFLAGGWWVQVVVNGLAIYLRSHKEEPLVLPSVLTALYIVAATYVSARFLSPDYFFLGFFTSYIWGLPWVIWIFKEKRRKGHLNERPSDIAYDRSADI